MEIASNTKYKQLIGILSSEISDSELKPGDRMPSEIELAKKYGISLGTVRQATAELVSRGILVKKQGVGTFVAEKLRVKTHTIGLILTDIGNYFFSQIARSIQHAAHEKKYSVIYYNTHDNLKREGESIQMLLDKGVDGIIIVPLIESGETGLLNQIYSRHIPFVYLDRAPKSPAGPSIETDNVKGTQMAVEHLISLGHRRIVCISSRPSTTNVKKRIKGYVSTMQRHGITADEQLVERSDLEDDDGGWDATRKLLSLSPKPTAIFAVNDITAIGAYRAAKERGLAVPAQLSIIGFDDIELSSQLDVPLTTIAQPIATMGEMAVSILLESMEKKHAHVMRKVKLEPKLMVRQSTRKI